MPSELRQQIVELVYKQESDAAAGNVWTVDQFVDAVLGLFPERAEDNVGRVLTVRENPPLPSDEQLFEWYETNAGDLAALPSIVALRAICRVGIDIGMVAP